MRSNENQIRSKRSQTGSGAPDSGTTFLTMLAIFSRVWDSPDAELSNRDTGISGRTISCQMYRTGPVSLSVRGSPSAALFASFSSEARANKWVARERHTGGPRNLATIFREPPQL